MPMFILLGRFTDEGAKNVPGFLAGLDENRARGESLGLKLHGWYLTQGQYDFVVIAEGPDAESVLKQAVGVAGRGMSRSETMRAYTVEEARRLFQ